MHQLERIAPLFLGWDETMIRSVLQGHMGYAIVDDEASPASAQLVLGDFCFFGGVPSEQIAAKAASEELVPQNEAWCEAIERAWGDQVVKRLRYAIKKEPDVFCRETLQYYVDSLPCEYELRLFDESLYAQSFSEKWSRDFCACFQDCGDFLRRGFGAAILRDGEFVSGASSYTVYDGGIEIEIDTKPEYRQRGLATVCGAKLILEALDRGLYPSWDAFDLRSVSLAEKLGYHVDHPYVIYVMR
jgi:GNAT superfamily N-acetyltransferase